MDFTRKQILEVQSALQRLDTFKFTGKTRIQIANRIRRVSEAVEDIQTAQKGLVAQYGLTGQVKEVNGQHLPVDDPAKTREHNLEWTALLGETQDIKVGKFLLADLDLTTNNLSIGTLMQLLPVLSDVPKADVRTITLRQGSAMAVAQALSRVDTPDAPLKLPYGRKLALAELLERLAKLIDGVEHERQQLITTRGLHKHRRNAAGHWEVADDQAELKAWADVWGAILKREIQIEVPTLSSADLDLDTNNIPGSILGELLLILTDPIE